MCKNDEVVERLDQAKIEDLTIMNTVQEGVDAIYLNDLENDFEDESDANTDEYGIDGSDLGEDY